MSIYIWMSIGILVLFFIVVGGGFYGAYRSEKSRIKKQKEEYNLCKCTKCGEKLKLAKIKSGTRTYVCPKCYRLVEVDSPSIDTWPDTGLYERDKEI